MDRFTMGYIACALWTEEMDHCTADDLSPDALRQMEEDCQDFQAANRDALDAANEQGFDDEALGHDFWLTRNHHGAGFWDRGLGDVGSLLTDFAHAYGDQTLELGEDGQVIVL